MANQEGKYNIKAISNILGIQPGTLRAWERRYQMIAPIRNDSGHRLYTDEHLKILRWLSAKVNEGFTISQAVSLMENGQLNQLPANEAYSDYTVELSENLLSALMQFDEPASHELINKAFSLYTIDKVIIDILGSIMLKIGDMWESGQINSAHEHFATSILRSRIGMVLQTMPHDSLLPKALAVCGPGEWHEIGLMIFTLFLRRKGFEVIYLGASVAEGDLEEVIQITKPKFLFLSCTMKNNAMKTIQLAQKLDSEYENLQIGLGGYAIDSLDEQQKNLHSPMIVGENQKEWEIWLKTLLS